MTGAEQRNAAKLFVKEWSGRGSKSQIQKTSQTVLDTHSLYPDSSAILYDEVTMPPEIRKAHQQNDRAVMEAYGFSVKEMTESKCVAELMKRYQELL